MQEGGFDRPQLFRLHPEMSGRMLRPRYRRHRGVKEDLAIPNVIECGELSQLSKQLGQTASAQFTEVDYHETANF